ncbi:MAG: class I SAM-dependent methyltransferase [Nitrososphaerales archaeon]
MQVKDFGRVADIYDATRSIPEPEMIRLIEAMRGRVGGKGPLLDVGVGTGRFALPLQRAGVEVVGIDVSRGMMAKAREKGAEHLVYADVQRIPFRDRAFQTALLVHILHLVGDWAAVVSESARVASDEVMAVIEVAEGTSLRQEYRHLRAEMGLPLTLFERGERGLVERVKPSEITVVAEFEQSSSADEEVQHLRERGQSLTWDVPDEAHLEIIETLSSIYGGMTFRTRERIELAVWSSKELREANLGA